MCCCHGTREYLQQLLSYLESFYQRTQPLASLSRQYSKLEEDLRHDWAEGTVPGWEDRGLGQQNGSAAAADAAMDLEAFDSLEELETLGE